MSYYEYKDMYEAAQKQKKGLLLCLFDVKNSRTDKNYPIKRNLYIKTVEKIAIKMNCINLNGKTNLNCGKNIILLGDACGFVVDTKNKEQVNKKVIELMKKENIGLSLHYDSGFFETFKYEEGLEKYYFGYAIQQIEENSKKDGCVL